MKRRHLRLAKQGAVLLFLGALLVNPQLTIAGESSYPFKDSKFPAAEAKLGWLDNERVMFHGYEVGKVGQPSPDDGHPLAETGLFIWNTGKDTVTKYWDIDGPVPLCVFHDRVSFLLRLKNEDAIRLQVMGKLGEEEQIRTVGDDWVNSFSCRYHEKKPKWFDEKRVRVGLREEHGYLDFGPRAHVNGPDAVGLMLYRPNETEAVVIPLNPTRILNLIEYAEFENAYVIKGIANTTDAVPVWLLRPDGTVMKILEPAGKAWEQFGWNTYHLTKKGLFLAGGSGDYASVGTRGGYLLRSVGETPSRLIGGNVRSEAVSPDGCKVAFVHVLNSQAGADSAEALRTGKSGSRTLKMIDLCKGD